MIDLIDGVMDKAEAETFTRHDVRHLLREYHRIDRIEMEIAQPDRLDEVLQEMVRRDLLERTDERWRRID